MEVRNSLVSLILVTGLLVPVLSVPKSYFYRHGEDAGDHRLPSGDEISSPEIALRTPIVFFGQVYHSIFINSNGFVSFLTEIPNFFNVQFPLDYPIIAPFYSDVDDRGTGAIWYRETSDPGTMLRSKTEIQEHFSDATNFEPQGAFIATWDGVGPYNQRTDLVNTFQLVLLSDGEESYALFHYADGGIQWLQGDGKNPSIADARGQAGLVSGDGRFFNLKASGTDQVRSIDKWSNVGKAGVWMYRIGQLSVSENVKEPDLGVGDEASQGIDVGQSCALGGSLCHFNAYCIDYTPGFCCSCEDTYMGNGINCVPKGEPVRVTGKVVGEINGVTLTDFDLHSYVLTAEGRTYTALSRVPSQIGYDVQSITAIGTGIAWLFAVPVNNVKNGFATTGGSMNRTVVMDFPQTGHRVEVQQQFEGLDVFNYVQVKTQITGSVPTIPLGAALEMNAFNEEYTKVKPGQLRARSSRAFRLRGQTFDTPFTVETTVDFDECQWKTKKVGEQETLRLKVPENIFIQYDEAEEIVRYALSAKLAPLEEIDPCVEGRQQCGENSQCVVDGDTFRCVCARGYEEVYDITLNQGICLDLNECSTSRDNCHSNAVCLNTPGSFTCTCKATFTGDGINCEKVESCEGYPCHPNGFCVLRHGRPQCTCLSGFIGDGFSCTKESEVTSTTLEQRTCVDYDVCSPNAECRYDDSVRSFRCFCISGYTGDGQTCHAIASCATAQDCSPYGVCARVGDTYRCECMAGFHGDGHTCTPADPEPPNQPEQPLQPYNPVDQHTHSTDHHTDQSHIKDYNTDHQTDHQIDQSYHVDDETNPYPVYPLLPQLPELLEPECNKLGVCWCPQNYVYVSQQNYCKYQDASVPGRDVVPEPYCGAAKCTCVGDYHYDAITHTCKPGRGGSDYPDTDVVARPLPDCYGGQCICPLGYAYDYSQHACLSSSVPEYNYTIQGGGGQPTVSCHDVNTCHPDAQCTYVSYTQSYSCQCNAGYDGDGYYCNKLDVSCDKVDICNIHAECVYDDQSLQHVCVCTAGYQGDGLVCTPQDECNSVVDCDINAQCLYDSSSQRYKCACNNGYDGDGYVCALEGGASCNIVNNCDINANCIYDTYALVHRCQCRDGYDGDGIVCNPTQIGCNVLRNCGQNAVCSYSEEFKGYQCTCQEGFEGDGFFCKSSRSCLQDQFLCHPDAECVAVGPSFPSEYTCQCREGFTGDGINCQEAPRHESDILLINQGLAILRMNSDPHGGRSYIIHFEAFMTAVGADIDCLEGRFYWTDVRSSSIRSSKYDGTERQPTVSRGGIGFPEDVAVDWVSRNVYWTDSTNDIVSVASINDSKQRKVITEGLVNPRGIAVHPGLGLLFWSDWNRLSPKIEVSGMDGSGRQVIVNKDILLPNSLVVDYETQSLCWADAGTHTIECIGMQGSGRRVVTKGPRYPFGLTILGQHFYYTDWNDTKIHTVDRYTGLESGARVPPPGGSGKLYGISAVPQYCPQVSNVCAVDHGGCPDTHLCLPNGQGGRTCACTDADLETEGHCTDYTY